MAKPAPLTIDELGDAMLSWVHLVTRAADGRRFTGVRKDLYFCPASGEFKISASGQAATIAQTRADAVKAFNAIELGKL